MSMELGTFGETLANLAEKARVAGDFGIFAACITILAHINPDFAKATVDNGVPRGFSSIAGG
jgi:hypothetical protein